MLESLETSLRLYRPGTSIREVTGEVVRIMITGLVKLGILHGDVDQLIADNAQRPFFMHGLSHWLGLDVHDVGVYGGIARVSSNRGWCLPSSGTVYRAGRRRTTGLSRNWHSY